LGTKICPHLPKTASPAADPADGKNVFPNPLTSAMSEVAEMQISAEEGGGEVVV
jgi:hypothetical protein